MALWCRDFPTVTVPHGDTPKPVTFVVPYYENYAFFGAQIGRWIAYPRPLRDRLSVVVVDDGSPTRPAAQVFDYIRRPDFLRLFRIHVDVRWNWLAARNIGAHHAADGWLLLTDMDHVVPAETLQAIVYGQHDPSVVYAFSRQEHTGEAIGPHSASFLMTRAMFWAIGGYDERMSGYYGSDGHYRRRVAATAPIQVLTDVLVRHEYQGDSSTTTYQRKHAIDARLRPLVASFPKGSKPKVLSFPYAEVA